MQIYAANKLNKLLNHLSVPFNSKTSSDGYTRIWILRNTTKFDISYLQIKNVLPIYRQNLNYVILTLFKKSLSIIILK